MTSTVRRSRSAPRGSRAEQLVRAAERRRSVDRLARERTAAGTAIHTSDVVALLDVAPKTAEEVLAELTDAGLLVRLAFRDGWVSAAAPHPARRTLADLLHLARRQTSAETTARKGRQSEDLSRDLEHLTPSQLADIERLVDLIVRHTPGAAGDPARVGDALLTWDPTAEGGRGGWALQGAVERWACADHRARKDRSAAGHPGAIPTPWRPEMARATVRKYRGAVNNLLFLAATHGLIPRSPRNPAGARTLYTPEWVQPLERWARWLLRPGRSLSNHRIWGGLRTLAIIATRLGFRVRRETDWSAVRDAIIDAHQDGTLSRAAFEHARYTWREVIAHLAYRCPGLLAEGLAWPTRRGERTTLVPLAAIQAAARETSMSARDFSGWVDEDGAPLTGLVEGTYGLRALCAWLTLPDAQLPGQTPPLPPRVWAQAPANGRRRKRNARPRQYRATSLGYLLRTIAQFARFFESRGLDWRSADLSEITAERVMQYVAWADAQPADPRGDRRVQLRHTVALMARIFNGFLAARANQQGAHALRTGFLAAHRTLEEHLVSLPHGKGEGLKAQRAAAIATANAWRGVDQVDGLAKIGRLIDALTEEAIAEVGGVSLEEQHAALLAGVFRPTRAWAETIRLAVLLTLLQRIPLRGHTVAQLETTMLLALPAAMDQQGQELQPWEGALSLALPGRIMKSGEDFNPPLILPEHVRTALQPGSEAHEAGLRRALWAVYLTAGGARDLCRTASGRRTPTPWLFPDVDGEGRQWDRPAISRAFRSAVLRHAGRLGVHVPTMRQTRGALGIHAIRKLFGTRWARVDLIATSRLLDHADVGITAAIYVARDERTMCLDAAAVG